ncbi:hypothetical protein WR164_01880 [Philodulcilactobacillus myokoensis]|uniref:Restriction endonuclease type IV Mrr domain-containing protein n=1 Tax=Philodulcilactobacillus myokoensis TaxID=2929573 RepID=A0A9W6ESJ7_9LACO|nr:restriction endonuclease [Philodulcilactobacillus myokoensis]GLB46209.1 hypothetical protein WR164_01880 [Philodulcilactobacillus myokoensis]
MNFLKRIFQEWRKQRLRREIEKMDRLDGYQFEDYVAKILKKNGFENVRQTSKIHDNGLDVIAERDGKVYGFQCKHYVKRTVGMKAVRQTFVGGNAYQVDSAILLVNRDFDQKAITLAKQLEVKLWGREKLIELMK